MATFSKPIRASLAGDAAATKLFESFSSSEREAVSILARLHQHYRDDRLPGPSGELPMSRTASTDTQSSSASPTPSPIITITECLPADNEPAAVEAVVLSSAKRKASPVVETNKRRRMSSGASGSSGLVQESVKDEDSCSDTSRPGDSNSWTPYEVSWYDTMVQQIPQADRITTNMFGGKIGRNELLAIYLAFTVGGYFDRKRISSRNQASDKAKENECKAAGIPYHKPVSIDVIMVPQHFRRLICAAHYSSTGQLLDATTADLNQVPLPRVAILKKDEVWYLGDALKLKQEELAAAQQLAKGVTGKKVKSAKGSIKYSSVPVEQLRPAPAGTRVFDSEEALATYDAALATARGEESATVTAVPAPAGASSSAGTGNARSMTLRIPQPVIKTTVLATGIA